MIEPTTLGIGMGLFVLGYIAHSNNTHKATTKNIETMLDQNKELVELSSTIEILNRDIDRKNSQIEDLKGEAAHQQENINRLLESAYNIRNSGELAQLEELAQKTKNFKQIEKNLTKVQSKNANRFNISVLISIVQTQYEHIHGEELDLLGVQHLMEDFSDSGSNTGSGTAGTMGNNPAKPNKTKPYTPGA